MACMEVLHAVSAFVTLVVDVCLYVCKKHNCGNVFSLH